MAIVTVVTNNKGGVAKTTTAVNLAAALRGSGFDVLCIDMDGQRNLTDTFGVDTSTAQGTIYDTLKARITPYVQPVRVFPSTGKGVGVLDVLPSVRDMFAAEVMLSNEPDRVTRFRTIVDKYRDTYDVIVIDTPPTIGLLSISALYAADNVVIPTNPDFLASRGLVSVRDTIQDVNGNRDYALKYRVLFCKYDRRKSLHRLTVEQVRAALPTYDTPIRDNVALSEAPAAQSDIFRYAPRSYGAEDYRAFATEYVKAYKVRHLNHKY